MISENKKRTYYSYYDTPDGCDVQKKVGVTTRYGVTAGLIMSTYDVLMYSHAVGFRAILARYAKHTIPLSLMGATFALVANGVQHLRDKDDMLNYFLGGFACGPILKVYLGSTHALVVGGIFLGLVGIVKKTAIDNNFTLLPDPKPDMGSITGWRHDYTLVPDPRDEMIRKCSEQCSESNVNK